MLLGNVDVSATDRVLEARPESFNRIGMVDTFPPFLVNVANRAVVVTGLSEMPIAHRLIGADRAALVDTLGDFGLDGLGLAVGDHNSLDRPLALNDTEYHGLVGIDVAPDFLALLFAADECFIDLDVRA